MLFGVSAGVSVGMFWLFRVVRLPLFHTHLVRFEDIRGMESSVLMRRCVRQVMGKSVCGRRTSKVVSRRCRN